MCRFSSFFESRGQPLLDLSLYVSSENYTTCTRSAYANILSWPGSWVTPPELRAAVRNARNILDCRLSTIDNTHKDVAEESKMTA